MTWARYQHHDEGQGLEAHTLALPAYWEKSKIINIKGPAASLLTFRSLKKKKILCFHLRHLVARWAPRIRHCPDFLEKFEERANVPGTPLGYDGPWVCQLRSRLIFPRVLGGFGAHWLRLPFSSSSRPEEPLAFQKEGLHLTYKSREQ